MGRRDAPGRFAVAGMPSEDRGPAVSAAPRFEVLDAMRGLAAFAVVIHHAWMTLPESLTDPWLGFLRWPLGLSPLFMIHDGRAAVMFFFVLSGFVLALPLLRGGAFSYGVYAGRRFCRIWLPFAASILLSVALYHAIAPGFVEGVSRWFHTDSWQVASTADLVVLHLLMFGTNDVVGLNNVMWSLVYELRISLIFPLIVLLTRGPIWLAVVTGLAVQLGADVAIHLQGLPLRPYNGADAMQSLLLTAHFLGSFMLGALLARHRELLLFNLARMHGWTRPILWAAAICLVAFRLDPVSAVGAALLILLALESARFQRLMSRNAFIWLGRNSFSLYLVHLPVLLTLVHGFAHLVPVPTLVAVSIGVSLLASEVMYRLVEGPSIALGRSVGRRMR
jgi:peptidoglycan/LPS O-acetylase OafA/YrhL